MKKKALLCFLLLMLVCLMTFPRETVDLKSPELPPSRIVTKSGRIDKDSTPKTIIRRAKTVAMKLPFIESVALLKNGRPLFQRFFHAYDSLPFLQDQCYDWALSTPEDQGFDSFIFEGAAEEAAKLGFVDSLLVVSNGRLIMERYYNDSDQYEPKNVFSCAKSITSALIGVAIKQGYLHNTDDRLVDFFQNYITPGMDPRTENITVRHLLSMRAGFLFDGTRQEWASYLQSRDWMRYALNLPLKFDPGASFHYSTIETDLLSGILAQATGWDTKEFAEDELFSRLGISVWYWQMDSKGHYSGGHGMYFTPRDMARFAQLYLQNGNIDGQQILPPWWVQESITGNNTIPFPWDTLKNGNYGFSWWTGELGGYDVYCSIGIGGQAIINVPELNMSIVTTCRWQGDQSEGQEAAILQFVGDAILSPIKALTSPLPFLFGESE